MYPKLTVPDLNLYVRPLENGDIERITPNLRDSDVIEIAAMMGPEFNTQDCLSISVGISRESYAIIKDGEPISLFGVSDSEDVENFGVPWFVGTDGLNDVALRIARYSKGWVQHLSKNYEALYNFVHIPHWQSQKWLQLLGFNVVTQHKYGFNGEDFYLFIKECS